MKWDHLDVIPSLAIVGATGLVGKEFLAILEERRVKVPRLKLLASERSAGESVEFAGKTYVVEALTEKSFEDVDLAFFSVPTDVTRTFVPVAAESGCLVFDDSNAYRMDPEVPLVVPQVNGGVLRDFDGRIVATPNCSTTPLAMVLKPLMDSYGLKRVVVSTYQSVSGAGRQASEELSSQCVQLLNGASTTNEVFPHQIAFNCLPRIGSMLDNGYTEEEQKVTNELRKILGLAELRVSATAVRVPTFCGHGISAHIELEQDFDSVNTIRELLESFAGLKVLDNPGADIYPTNMECIGSDDTLVGRIRRDPSVDSGLSLWIMADNLRKGAALNILESVNTLYGYRRSH